MIIFIKNLIGKIIKLNVKPTDNIRFIKDKIFELENVFQCQQRLIMNGEILKDTNTLEQYNIKNESCIYFLISIEEYIQVQVRTEENTIFTINVSPSEKISLVKTMIKILVSLTDNKQILKFKSQVLENEKKLSDYRIGDKSTIDLVLNKDKPITVQVKEMNGHRGAIPIEVYLKDDIKSLRERVHEIFYISTENKILLMFSQKILQDKPKIYEYNIQDSSEIYYSLLRNQNLNINQDTATK